MLSEDEKSKHDPTVQEEDLRSRLDSARSYIEVMDVDLNKLHSRHDDDRKQWNQLQKDLQMAVVVANDIKVGVDLYACVCVWELVFV